jgi:hypothetical protein
MNKLNVQRVSFSATLFFLLLIVGTSCSENASDESPKHLNSSIESSGTEDASLSTSASKVKIKNIGKKIPNETAKRWLASHKQKNPNGINYYLFGKETFDRLLDQPTAAGIRLCNAFDDSGNPVIVMVAVDENNNLLDGAQQEGYEDASQACPPICASSAN